MNNDLSQKDIKERFNYDPDTGRLTYAIKNKVADVGDVAGWISNKGYRSVKINDRCYQVHRLVFVYMLGRWPNNFVDHKNGDTLDNRWSNLRECTHSQNHFNEKLRSDNTSGVKGVTWRKRSKKWVAQISINEKQKCLGYFEHLKDAKETVEKYRRKYHKDFYNDGYGCLK